LHRLNFYLPKHKLASKYNNFADALHLSKSNRERGLNFDECVAFLEELKQQLWPVRPLDRFWFDLFGANEKVAAPTFLEKFFHETQGEKELTLCGMINIFKDLYNSKNLIRQSLFVEEEIATNESENNELDQIDKDMLESYISHRCNNLFDPCKKIFKQDSMSKPLSHYWINSSHNTYLTGDQLASDSSAQMYMDALYKGCRCVEIDVWDGQEDSSQNPVPVVLHGHTLTKKIDFSEVIKTIKVFLNFNPDSYPVILSLENHCSIPYQEAMAETLVNVFGDVLFTPNESDLNGLLPSPESLKGMVVIKGKRPRDESEFNYSYKDEGDDNRHILGENTEKPKIEVKVSPMLAQLTLLNGTKFKSFDESIHNPCYYMHSMDEAKIEKMQKKHKEDMVVYNKNHLTRTYPGGLRIGSTNYNPVSAWSMGCQIVALNFQSPGDPLFINDGFFRQNGNCGYVMKEKEVLDGTFHNSHKNLTMELTIEVISCSFLPKPEGKKEGECIDPYVEVKIYEVDEIEGKEISKGYKTKTIQDNGFFPVWDKEVFKFSIQNSCVAMLVCTIWDKDIGNDDFIASAAIPVSCLRQGYRNVRIRDANNTNFGPFDFASLFVKVDMEQADTASVSSGPLDSSAGDEFRLEAGDSSSTKEGAVFVPAAASGIGGEGAVAMSGMSSSSMVGVDLTRSPGNVENSAGATNVSGCTGGSGGDALSIFGDISTASNAFGSEGGSTLSVGSTDDGAGGGVCESAGATSGDDTGGSPFISSGSLDSGVLGEANLETRVLSTSTGSAVVAGASESSSEVAGAAAMSSGSSFFVPKGDLTLLPGNRETSVAAVSGSGGKLSNLSDINTATNDGSSMIVASGVGAMTSSVEGEGN